ncbi:hypothetical protein Q428_13105 [Fervidicella metallireducens AeB]|uniref:Abasic site processing protein n=1 Tax=Fervidicella metallireducens AeB TaxID=1403537 RepID=A0A017RS65_9CLOT|nr:SOS response-associated peptidase [Fervidicella metallireducens]EYE87477.1 hypothetical protein Q428_13105 [Fervidicella metallireducens AeB]
MCGRVVLDNDFKDILKRYFIEQSQTVSFKKGEGFPGDNLIVALNDDKKRLDAFSWGFIVNNKRIINARSETILQKHLFKEAFIQNRCLIPVNGFFEWKKEDTKKVKYRIALKGETIFSLAGIYRDFLEKDGSKKRCVTIITTQPNKEMCEIHNRMPVIIDRRDEELYLSKNFDESLLNLLRPFKDGSLIINRVDNLHYENISFL